MDNKFDSNLFGLLACTENFMSHVHKLLLFLLFPSPFIHFRIFAFIICYFSQTWKRLFFFMQVEFLPASSNHLGFTFAYRPWYFWLLPCVYTRGLLLRFRAH